MDHYYFLRQQLDQAADNKGCNQMLPSMQKIYEKKMLILILAKNKPAKPLLSIK